MERACTIRPLNSKIWPPNLFAPSASIRPRGRRKLQRETRRRLDTRVSPVSNCRKRCSLQCLILLLVPLHAQKYLVARVVESAERRIRLRDDDTTKTTHAAHGSKNRRVGASRCSRKHRAPQWHRGAWLLGQEHRHAQSICMRSHVRFVMGQTAACENRADELNGGLLPRSIDGIDDGPRRVGQGLNRSEVQHGQGVDGVGLLRGTRRAEAHYAAAQVRVRQGRAAAVEVRADEEAGRQEGWVE
mmetsp:Transcript_57162/g.185756  ORF Transcript_57162/g.185756 Transcript_57162/m.185756 type:complete len:244 (-) Transcript_57162:1249-1980(-)